MLFLIFTFATTVGRYAGHVQCDIVLWHRGGEPMAHVPKVARYFLEIYQEIIGGSYNFKRVPYYVDSDAVHDFNCMSYTVIRTV